MPRSTGQRDREAADLQIGELRPQERHTRYMAILVGMVGGDLRHHAIGRDDFENVQTFQDRSGQSHPSIIFQASRARHAGVALGEGDQSLDADFFGEAGKVAAPAVFQRDRRMPFDLLLDRDAASAPLSTWASA